MVRFRSVRVLGVIAFVLGACVTPAALRRALDSTRPADVGWSVLSAGGVAVAILGLVLALVPGFLG